MLKFPVPISSLLERLPHRPPMVWIDSVTEVGETSGTCKVEIDLQKHYSNGTEVRPSSLIEWIAQSYAYCGVLRDDERNGIAKAFLVGVTDFTFRKVVELSKLRTAVVKVSRVKELLPLIILKGEILSEEGFQFASALLKVYVETIS